MCIEWSLGAYFNKFYFCTDEGVWCVVMEGLFYRYILMHIKYTMSFPLVGDRIQKSDTDKKNHECLWSSKKGNEGHNCVTL